MVRIQQQRSKSGRWNQDICPNVFKKIKTWIVQSGNCHAMWNGKDGYEVKYFDHGNTVNLMEKTCSCRYWQLSGLPCPHALSCIFYSRQSVDTYIQKCYTVECFRKIYNHCLEPIEGMSSCPISARPIPLPPMYGVMPGRPSGERRREPHEKPKISKASKMSRTGTKIRCSRCKEYGHNKKTCEKKMAATAATVGEPSDYATHDKAMVHKLLCVSLHFTQVIYFSIQLLNICCFYVSNRENNIEVQRRERGQCRFNLTLLLSTWMPMISPHKLLHQ